VSTRGLLDTGPLVAFLDRNDHHHLWAKQALSRFSTPLSTCEAVVSEAWHLMGRARGGRAALLGVLEAGHLRVASTLEREAPRTYRLMAKYSDQPMSVAGACLVRMAEADPRALLITLDRDFLVYRPGRGRLRLVAPFVRD